MTTKITEMTPGAALDGSELFEMVQSAATFSTDADAIKTWCSAAPTLTGTVSSGGNLLFTTAASGITLKRGANGRCGTFVCNGVTPVAVANTSIEITDTIVISLNTVGGTVGATPSVKTITAGVGFDVAGDASDTSTYNYAIIRNAA